MPNHSTSDSASGDTLSPWKTRYHSRSGRVDPSAVPYVYAPKGPEDPWEECKKVVDKFDDDMCQGWKDDLSTLLTFAGLLTAVVTTFTSESYQWLKEDSQDTTNGLLLRLIQEVSNSSTASAPEEFETSFSPTPSSIRINALWFLSITTSLSAALIGLLCQQWIRAYQRDASMSAKDSLRLRQMRFQGLEAWHVSHIIASLPIIIQAAVWLFFAGMLDLLWSLNTPLVAILCSAFVGTTGTLALATTVVPAVYYLLNSWTLKNVSPERIELIRTYHDGLNLKPCPYKSPQAWLCFSVLFHTCRAISHVALAYFGLSAAAQRRAMARTQLWLREQIWNVVMQKLTSSDTAATEGLPPEGPSRNSSWVALEKSIIDRDTAISTWGTSDRSMVSASFYLQQGLVWTVQHLGNKTVRKSALQWILSEFSTQHEIQYVVRMLGSDTSARVWYDKPRLGELLVLDAEETWLKGMLPSNFTVEISIRVMNSLDLAEDQQAVGFRLQEITTNLPRSLRGYQETDILQQLVMSLHGMLETPETRSILKYDLVELNIVPLIGRFYTSDSVEAIQSLDMLHQDLISWSLDNPHIHEDRVTNLARSLIRDLQPKDAVALEPVIRYGLRIDAMLRQLRVPFDQVCYTDTEAWDWEDFRKRFLGFSSEKAEEISKVPDL